MSRKIPVINGLRGWAIILVVLFHVFIGVIPEGVGEDPALSYLKSSLYNAQRGVDLFFMLSAFVLTLPYLRKERTMKTMRDIFWFYRHRAARLLPLYYVNIILAMFVIHPVPAVFGAALRDTVLMSTFLFHFTPDLWMPPYNYVLWSIGVEFWFCVLLPFLLIAIRRYGMAVTLVPLYVIAVIVQYAGILTVENPLGTNVISDNVIGRLDDFIAGILMAVCYVRGVRPLGSWALPAGIAAVLGSAACMTFVRMEIMTVLALPLLLQVLNAGLFLVVTGALHLKKGSVYGLFAAYPLQMLGLMCYSLYVWHALIIPYIGPSSGIAQFALYILVLLSAGWLSYRYTEFGRVTDVRKLLPERA